MEDIRLGFEFWLNIGGSIAVVGAAYGALRTDLKNLHLRVDEERRLREEHSKMARETLHDMRDQIQVVVSKVAVLEDRSQLAPLLMQIRDRLPKES
jgi:hypothetical protein